MAYPPDFDQAYDITQPLDSSAANLIGQDIRDLTNEVMQRMALLSGVFANRPTPETVNATWGGSGFGILYFSTDTGQVFQWNGSAWIDVSLLIGRGTGKIFSSGLVTMAADTTKDVIYSGTVKGGSLGSDGIINFDLTVTGVSGTGNVSIFLEYGGNEVNLVINLAVSNSIRIFGYLQGYGTTGSQIVVFSWLEATSTIVYVAPEALSTDSTVDQTFSISAQKTSAAATVQFLSGTATIIAGS